MTGKKEDDKRKSINMRDDDDVGGSCGDYSLPEGVTGADALQILQSLVKNKVLNSDQIKQFAPKNNLESQKKKTKSSSSGHELPKTKKSKTFSSSKQQIVPSFPENTRFRHIALRFQSHIVW